MNNKRANSFFRFQTIAYAILAAWLLTACDSGGGGSSSSDTDDGNGCQAGYCNSNGLCCPSNMRYECQGNCYASSADANAANPGQCNNFRTEC
jgi:hypothetical protein